MLHISKSHIYSYWIIINDSLLLITLMLELLIFFYYLYNKLCEVESAVFGHTVVLGNVILAVC